MTIARNNQRVKKDSRTALTVSFLTSPKWDRRHLAIFAPTTINTEWIMMVSNIMAKPVTMFKVSIGLELLRVFLPI
ncbi:MAG: hypothetical protein R3313_05265 [Candidatus Saccharimonadales bacterium]|nr:hypothetical protein [Candidatus Saccharimonadales bacterium]